MQVPYKKISNLVQDLTHTNIADIGDYFVKSVNAHMITKKEQGYMNHMKKVGKLRILSVQGMWKVEQKMGGIPGDKVIY